MEVDLAGDEAESGRRAEYGTWLSRAEEASMEEEEEEEAEAEGAEPAEWDGVNPTFSLMSLSNVTHFIVLL